MPFTPAFEVAGLYSHKWVCTSPAISLADTASRGQCGLEKEQLPGHGKRSGVRWVSLQDALSPYAQKEKNEECRALQGEPHMQRPLNRDIQKTEQVGGQRALTVGRKQVTACYSQCVCARETGRGCHGEPWAEFPVLWPVPCRGFAGKPQEQPLPFLSTFPRMPPPGLVQATQISFLVACSPYFEFTELLSSLF